MDRLIRINSTELDYALRLTVEDRLRQANAAFRLYHQLHNPFAKPFLKGFSDLESFTRFNEENSLRYGPFPS